MIVLVTTQQGEQQAPHTMQLIGSPDEQSAHSSVHP
jgi:hypothetical protein